MTFQTFYGQQADQFSFIYIPKALMTEDHFSGIQSWSKIIYGFLMDRMRLSAKNRWIDERGRMYVIYPAREMQKDMGIPKKKVLEYLKELEDAGLLEKKPGALGLPDRIYLKNIKVEQT